MNLSYQRTAFPTPVRLTSPNSAQSGETSPQDYPHALFMRSLGHTRRSFVPVLTRRLLTPTHHRDASYTTSVSISTSLTPRLHMHRTPCNALLCSSPSDAPHLHILPYMFL